MYLSDEALEMARRFQRLNLVSFVSSMINWGKIVTLKPDMKVHFGKGF
jgi:hypothetical protein